MVGRTVIGTPDEETMDIVLPKKYHEVVGVIFRDTFSYQLKFNWGYRIPAIKEHTENTGNCMKTDYNFFLVLHGIPCLEWLLGILIQPY